jgi:hypothetical protein
MATDADKFVLEWASKRLQRVLGQDVSDVCEYLVAIEVCRRHAAVRALCVRDGAETAPASKRDDPAGSVHL